MQGKQNYQAKRNTGVIMKYLMFIFYVCILWLTGIIRITHNDFLHKAEYRFGTFEASHSGNNTIANTKNPFASQKSNYWLCNRRFVSYRERFFGNRANEALQNQVRIMWRVIKYRD